MRYAHLLFSIALFVPVLAMAGEPAAIIEDIDVEKSDIQFMDYVSAGKVITLGKNGTLVLGYLKNCLREKISGGTVTVGNDKSKVVGGTVRRETVECDGGNLNLKAAEAGKSAVTVFRAPPSGSISASKPRPEFNLFGSSPVITAKGGVSAIFTRIDKDGAPISIPLEHGIADFAALGKSLAPGGLYRVKVGNRERVFKVDPFAEAGKGPLAGRLIRF